MLRKTSKQLTWDAIQWQVTHCHFSPGFSNNLRVLLYTPGKRKVL